MTSKSGRVRTTVSVDRELLEGADRVVEEGEVRSRGELLERALRSELHRIERQKIDAAFSEMAFDEEYRKDAGEVCREFEEADREAMGKVSDGEQRGEGSR